MPRTLIFIVAYQAERHIESVLDRVPKECLDHPEVHILCIDDSSADRSAAAAAGWFASHGVRNATVLRNTTNQGYGGNQKLGYRFALERDFELVILLHGDGQYAPENIPDFVRAAEETGAEVILGSRMGSVRRAAEGGMPAYKILGNRLLTGFQNLVTGARLSEYHTGYRAYSRSFLASVPFELNTNDFHFDTEILLQAIHVGARISEFDIPTHYGDEICRVNGASYALHVIGATLRYRMHQLGMLCSLRYRVPGAAPARDRAPFPAHVRALARVGRLEPRSVLDVGCGHGFVAGACEASGLEVTGVDLEPPAEGRMTSFHRWDLDRTPLPFNPLAFDVILMLDVLEQLDDPEAFLLSLRNDGEWSGPPSAAPRLILTTPNVAFLAVRLNLLLGRFNYAERGILNIGNKRLFTKGSLLTLLEECGYSIEECSGLGVPFAAVFGGWPGRLLGALSQAAARLWPSLLAFQFLVVARPTPGLHQLLASSEAVPSRRSAGDRL